VQITTSLDQSRLLSPSGLRKKNFAWQNEFAARLTPVPIAGNSSSYHRSKHWGIFQIEIR
jgi:hypothetical protein